MGKPRGRHGRKSRNGQRGGENGSAPRHVVASSAPKLRAAFRGSWKLCGTAILMFAILSLASGPIYLAQSRSAEHWLGIVRDLPVAGRQPAGTRVLAEGTIVPDAEPVFRSFVAHVEETRRSAGRGADYFVQERERKSAFAVETAFGTIRLASANYRFTPETTPLPFWPASGSPLVPQWDHVEARGGSIAGGPVDHLRHRGLVATGPVIVIGSIGSPGTITPEYVMAGTRAGLTAHLAELARGEGDVTGFWLMTIGIAGIVLTSIGWIALLVRSVYA